MTTTVDGLRAEYRSDTCFVSVPSPRLSWTAITDQSDWLQKAAEIEWTPAAGQVQSHNLTGDESVYVPWPFEPLLAHQVGSLRVRVEGPDGWSAWSEPTKIKAGFLPEGQWQAKFIGLPSPTEEAQPGYLRTSFEVGADLTVATLFATAHGLHNTWLNGELTDDMVVKPGWTSYQWRLLYDTVDVTDQLRVGMNWWGVELAGGWHTLHYGFHGMAEPIYGDQPSFAGALRLEYADGRIEWVSSDDTWQATSTGPRQYADIYNGEHYDARVPHPLRDETDQSIWGPVGLTAAEQSPVGEIVPQPRVAPPVRRIDEVKVREVIETPSGKTVVDFGQNLVGWVRLNVEGARGQIIMLRHAEVLEHGELGVRPLRFAEATDRFTLAGTGEIETWEPAFTFHGFRYVEVTGEIDPAGLTAVVISSDLTRTGWFESSDPLLNRFHENVVWGMRGNFLSLPTDCPQRDERLGWTGDICVFAPTASFLHDCDGFLASWLQDLALEQAHGGAVPFTVPDVFGSSDTPTATWGDASVIVPWTLYQRFGDKDVLARQYPSMKAWVDVELELAGENHLWQGGWQFGDWLDPTAPPDRAALAKADAELVATASMFLSTRRLVETARLLGLADDADHYAVEAEAVRQAWLHTYVTPAGLISSDAPTAYAIGIEYGLCDTPELAQAMGDRLAELVRRDGYRIATGFVGTPQVADALTDTGHHRQAGRLVTQTECPSWLYAVTMGATTVWERWDSMLPTGEINPGEMTSFNHYAFGAVADWLHRVVAGLAPAAAGYRQISIRPQPIAGLTSASAHHLTPYGPASVKWQCEGSDLIVTAEIPPNTTAEVTLPGQDQFIVGSGRHSWTVPAPAVPELATDLGPATDLATIIDDREVYETIVTAIDQSAPGFVDSFRKTSWVEGRALFDSFTMMPQVAREAISQTLHTLNERRSAKQLA
jgi:alpha-L-rhamnosidase